MATIYTQATVQPAFPFEAVSCFEVEQLERQGFTLEIIGSDHGKSLYFYTKGFIEQSEPSWKIIFQAILKKPVCAAIEEICVMGAVFCDKPRPGESGG